MNIRMRSAMYLMSRDEAVRRRGPTQVIRPNQHDSNDTSGRVSRGEAPERAGEVLVLVGFGSLGRDDLVESPDYGSSIKP